MDYVGLRRFSPCSLHLHQPCVPKLLKKLGQSTSNLDCNRRQHIVAFGDGAHAVSINPEDVLQVGEKSNVFGVEITLNNTGFIKPVDYTSGAREYWFVEFSGKSISDEIQYGVNPEVESQLQYFQNGNYIWDLDEFDQRQCNDEHVLDGFEKNESFSCRLVYAVPIDKQDIYWVYARTGRIANGIYEERYAVFKIK